MLQAEFGYDSTWSMIWESEINLVLIILLILCVIHKFVYGDLFVECVG